MKLSNSIRDLPRYGSSSLRGDDHSTVALREMAREQSLVMQLRAVVLPAIQADDERAEVIAHMFETILDCSAKAITAIKLLRLGHGGRPRADDAAAVDDKRGVRKVFSDDGDCRVYDDNAKPHHLRKRRRLTNDCVTLERLFLTTTANGGSMARSSSTTKNTRGATTDAQTSKSRTARQRRRCSSKTTTAPALAAPDDYGQHTCKPSGVVETASTGTRSSGASGDGELARSESESVISQRGNISVTCTSVIVDVRHRTAPSSSLESNSNLLDIRATLADSL